MKNVNRDFPYHQPPQVDFFLYPPPQPITAEEKLALAAKLALDQPIPGEPFFTIFVSIPYCRSRCHSCHFFKGLLPPHADRYALLDEFVDCLKIQLRGYADTVRFSSARCGALYMGGGTASLLAPDQVDDLIRTVQESFTCTAEAEITLEGNPLDYAPEYLQQVKESGVTRLSLGLQSFQDAVLKVVGSAHDGQASREAAKNVRAVGFPTVNIDLLYKLPGQTIQDWRYDLQTALDFEPQSITVYAYVIHPGSAAERLVTSGRLGPPASPEEEQDWYAWTKQQLEHRGYVEEMKGYFSKPGHEKKYGTFNYKKCCEYLGLGGGAYSFVNRRQFTTRNEGELYVQQVHQGQFPVADYLSTPATDRNMMERYIMFNYLFSSLDRQDFCARFGQDPIEAFPHVFAKLEKYRLVAIDDGEIRLTDGGKKWRENIQNEFYADEFKSPVPAREGRVGGWEPL